MTLDWTPFATPVPYYHPCAGDDGQHGYLLAWRLVYHQSKDAFETPQIRRIEYLDSDGDLFGACIHMELFT